MSDTAKTATAAELHAEFVDLLLADAERLTPLSLDEQRRLARGLSRTIARIAELEPTFAAQNAAAFLAKLETTIAALAAAEADRERLAAQVAALRHIVERMQWACGDDFDQCPTCGRFDSGEHAVDCPLSEILRDSAATAAAHDAAIADAATRKERERIAAQARRLATVERPNIWNAVERAGYAQAMRDFADELAREPTCEGTLHFRRPDGERCYCGATTGPFWTNQPKRAVLSPNFSVRAGKPPT